ncbi:hypothetical protein N9D22_03375 [Flavobacteriaceae bacterium]|nr:hypothetical protein [Flavobacteriaceae bacterium]
MKKILIILVLISIQQIKSQSNLDYEIKYTHAIEDLKEFIVIQTLLCENRIDDLTKFMLEKSYVLISDNEYHKVNRRKKGEIVPLLIINDLQSTTDFDKYCNKVLRIFFYSKKDDLHIASWDELFNIKYTEAESIFMNMVNVPDARIAYPMFKNFKEGFETGEFDGIAEIEQIDRYTIKKTDLTTKKEDIYKASNWMINFALKDKKFNKNLGFVNDGTDTASRHVNFFGPGDVGPLCLSYSFGKYNNNNGTTQNVKLDIYAYKYPALKGDDDIINIDFFMALKNFNDRIWYDK